MSENVNNICFIFKTDSHLIVEEDHFELVATRGRARDDDPSRQIALRDGQPEKVCVLAFHRSTHGLTPN